MAVKAGTEEEDNRGNKGGEILGRRTPNIESDTVYECT